MNEISSRVNNVSRRARETCWNARDEYHDCLRKNDDHAELCKQFYEVYTKLCPPSWVKHFEEKRQYSRMDDVRRKLELNKDQKNP